MSKSASTSSSERPRIRWRWIVDQRRSRGLDRRTEGARHERRRGLQRAGRDVREPCPGGTDPTKVVRSALQNVASIASLLTTEEPASVALTSGFGDAMRRARVWPVYSVSSVARIRGPMCEALVRTPRRAIREWRAGRRLGGRPLEVCAASRSPSESKRPIMPETTL